MEICVCVKRVPMVGGAITVTSDGLEVDVAMSGFTVSPHEECAVEEAVQITERAGGSVTVLTLGPAEAAGQLRDMLALGAGKGVLLQTDGAEWGPVATAAAIAAAVRDRGSTCCYSATRRPTPAGTRCRCGSRTRSACPASPGSSGSRSPQATVRAGSIRAGREYRGAEELFDLPLPAVVSVKEGMDCRATRRCPAGCGPSGPPSRRSR